MIELSKDNQIFIVTMNDGANMICLEWQQRMLDILDQLEHQPHAGRDGDDRGG